MPILPGTDFITLPGVHVVSFGIVSGAAASAAGLVTLVALSPLFSNVGHAVADVFTTVAQTLETGKPPSNPEAAGDGLVKAVQDLGTAAQQMAPQEQ